AQGQGSRLRIGVLWLALLAVLFDGCSADNSQTSPSGTQSTPSSDISRPPDVAGIEADTRLVSTQGALLLEVTITTHLRQLERLCPSSQHCPTTRAFLIRSSALLDYRFSALADATELVVDNRVDATSSTVQVLTFQDLEPGDHCLTVFSQILEIDDGGVVGREGLIGIHKHLAADPSGSEASSGTGECNTKGLVIAEGDFIPSSEESCGGLPNGITTDPSGSALSANEVMVLVPTCPQDQIAVILEDGEVISDDTRLIVGDDPQGFLGFIMPRARGRWRVATLPDDRYLGTVPEGSSYWDVVISPPREF
ncbi:MAG: hypothetical protein WD895_10375, partial [Acidimicrobiia bacterium]